MYTSRLFGKFLIGCFALFNTVASAAYSLCPETDVNLSAGYRRDKITALAKSYNSAGIFLVSDELKAMKMDVYEIGLKGQVFFCDCWYARGAAYYGWICHGDYEETVRASSLDFAPIEGKIHSGHTWDALIGLGYLFSWSECMGIGPVAGWSYDHQHIKIKDTTIDDVPDPFLEGLVYKTRWQGPWLGIDALYQECCFQVLAGYEFHWTDWHGDWLLADGKVAPDGSFSDRRKAHKGYGHTVYLDGDWNFASCWNIGIGLKYQYWRATHGKLKPIADIDLGIIDEIKVPKATWTSYCITLDLGYEF